MPQKKTMARYDGAPASRKIIRRAATDKRRGQEDTDCRAPAKRARGQCARPAGTRG
jgi:hypothetical protein